MYRIGDNIEIRNEYLKCYPLIPSFGNIESIDSGWVAMRNFLGVLHLPVDRITLK